MKREVLTEAREQLLRRREQLLDLRNDNVAHEAEIREATPADWTDAASDVEMANVLDTLSEAERIELEEIREALLRLEAGTYGVCVACHDPIDSRRLHVQPTARYCLSCASARQSLEA